GLRDFGDDIEPFLREMLAGASDEDAAAHIQSSLDEIEIERKARLLDKARRVYRRRTGREIGDVAELARGEDRVLEKIPSPEPDAIPASLRRGSVWRIDPETKRFVSSYLGSRYEVHYSSWDRARLERWRTADAVDAPDDETVLEDRVEDEEVGPRGG
ncbi:MAG TPA: hypothetical protein PLW10_14330, partial [Myxococcota bacterium]|nr:hypothetical protein [Myxococcota bacterium]